MTEKHHALFMEGYGPTTYGQRTAEIYDDLRSGVVPEQVELLHELAGNGPVLELGIGTGRIALPLASRGVEVHGVDSSEAMVAKLRAKPGGEAIAVTLGDFRDFDLAERFSLVFVAFNTFFALPDQEAQLGCFGAVSRHLLPGGRFLLEAFVPDLGHFNRGQRVSAIKVALDEVHLECTRHDAVAQRVTTQHVVLASGGTRLYPVQIRYSWPSELDLMAKLAGLRLESRWDGWDRRPYTASSFTTISVWGARLG
jgi:SAM-dependent methyltransferase